MAAALCPPTRERRPGAQLKAPARCLLAHLQAAGSASRPELYAVLLAFDRLTVTAREHTVYNLQALGYTERKVVGAEVHWVLTPLGRRAVAGPAEQAPPPPPRPRTPPQARRDWRLEPAVQQQVAPPVRTVIWASRPVALPSAPRSVFDLGAAS